MPRKTQRVYASAELNGEITETVVESFRNPLDALRRECEDQGREPLYDTLEISVEREVAEYRTIVGPTVRVPSYATIEVSAEAVRHG